MGQCNETMPTTLAPETLCLDEEIQVTAKRQHKIEKLPQLKLPTIETILDTSSQLPTVEQRLQDCKITPRKGILKNSRLQQQSKSSFKKVQFGIDQE